MFGLSACVPVEDVSTPLVSAMPVSTENVHDNASKQYEEYAESIENGLNQFRNLVVTLDEFAPAIPLNIESRQVIGLSTQGGEITRFSTTEGQTVRYTYSSLGETGKVVSNYYYFDDGLVYIQKLSSEYADWNFGNPDNRNDILDYTLDNYVIDGEQIFRVDDNQKLVQAMESDIEIISLEKFDDYFENNSVLDEEVNNIDTDFENNPIDRFFMENNAAAAGGTYEMTSYTSIHAEAWKAEMENCYEILKSHAINDVVRQFVADDKVAAINEIEAYANLNVLFGGTNAFEGSSEVSFMGEDLSMNTSTNVSRMSYWVDGYREKTKELFEQLEKISSTPEFIFSEDDYYQRLKQDFPDYY
jgi:hypothetical protein